MATKEPRRFRVVRVQGTHYEMGRQYGEQCKDLIGDLVDRFDALVMKDDSFQAGREIARSAVPFVQDAAPELLEEVEGIAAGAGVDADAVFRLNCSVELFAWQGCVTQQSVSTVPRACSSFAARAAEGPLVAWNMDWWCLWQPYIVLLHGVPDSGPRFLAFAFAGCVGRPGMSEQVAVSANYLTYRGTIDPDSGQRVWAGPGVPYNFLTRIMLKQPSTEAAVAAATGVQRMASVNYTIGDRSGDICCLETTPDEHAVLRPEQDFIVHANAYHSPAFDGIPREQLLERDPRAGHGYAQLEQRGGKLSRNALTEVQTSHFDGQETGICVHRKLQDRDGISLLSFVADIRAGGMWAAYGPPCQHEYLLYEL